MASQLGRLISKTRKEKGLGLRALARQIDKSPSFVVMIENDDPAPGVAEETLRRLAEALDLHPDHVITLAGKTPDDVVPSDELEVAIYRLVKRLPKRRKQELLRDLQDRRS